MLILSRKLHEHILIGPDVVVSVVAIDRGRVRLAITAPDEVKIMRTELVRANDPRMQNVPQLNEDK